MGALNFIKAALKKNNKDGTNRVLVHCYAGTSRAPAVVLAYLIIFDRQTYLSAFDILRKRAPACRPNSGFKKQINRLYERLLDKNGENYFKANKEKS